MTKKNSAKTLLKVSQIRERQRKLALAQAFSEKQQAEDALTSLEEGRSAEFQEIRNQVTDAAVSAASLSLLSDAVVEGHRRTAEAADEVERLEEPLSDARDALTESRTKRRVAEKFAMRKHDTRIRNVQRKLQRQSDDMTNARTVNATD